MVIVVLDTFNTFALDFHVNCVLGCIILFSEIIGFCLTFFDACSSTPLPHVYSTHHTDMDNTTPSGKQVFLLTGSIQRSHWCCLQGFRHAPVSKFLVQVIGGCSIAAVLLNVRTVNLPPVSTCSFMLCQCSRIDFL